MHMRPAKHRTTTIPLLLALLLPLSLPLPLPLLLLLAYYTMYYYHGTTTTTTTTTTNTTIPSSSSSSLSSSSKFAARRLQMKACNSVFHQISAANLHALQSVLNAAARLVMRKRKYDHITATLRDDLHWLPVRQRVMYKLCTIVHKCLHAAAPPYLSELCIPVSTSA